MRIWETAAAIRDIPDIPTSCSCHNSSAEECGVFQRNCLSFPALYSAAYYPAIFIQCCRPCFGDIGEVSVKDMEADEEGYYIRGDYVGKLGVEKIVREIPAWRKGSRFCCAMRMDVSRDVIWTESMTVLPFRKNLTLSLDIDLQILGERLLKIRLKYRSYRTGNREILVWFLLRIMIRIWWLVVSVARTIWCQNAINRNRCSIVRWWESILRVNFQDGTGTDLPSKKESLPSKVLLPLFSWFPLWASDSGMSCSRLTFAIDSGYCDFLQLPFLLGGCSGMFGDRKVMVLHRRMPSQFGKITWFLRDLAIVRLTGSERNAGLIPNAQFYDKALSWTLERTDGHCIPSDKVKSCPPLFR